MTILSQDTELWPLVQAEEVRQREKVQLMAGESLTYPGVLELLGSQLVNKYAEGYPGARMHNGCEYVDQIEELAILRAKELFGAEYANVQPYSGTTAMLASYSSLLNPGDTVLAMSLSAGGHFSHGYPGNVSGRYFEFFHYGVDRSTGMIDYDNVRDLAHKHRPQAIVCGSTTYPRSIDYRVFREICDEVGSHLVVDASQTIGLVAGKAAENPVYYADIVCAVTHKSLRGPRGGLILAKGWLSQSIDQAVYPFIQGGPHMNSVAAKAYAFSQAASSDFSIYAHKLVENSSILAEAISSRGLQVFTGGTDTHQLVVDTAPLGLTGAQVRSRCSEAAIVLDSCRIPYEITESSGIRMGVSFLTALGFGGDKFREIGDLICDVISRRITAEAAAEVTAALLSHPA